MTLEELIEKGIAIQKNTYSNDWGEYVDAENFSDWGSLSLMFLQEHYPQHPQVGRFELYVKKGDSSLYSHNTMLGILKAFNEIRPVAQKVNFKKILTSLFEGFHSCAKQLKRRYNNRSTLEISDEYDVQDLLHALLRLNFDDVRPEEWTPSYAGGNNRMDFLIKDEEIAIEVKMTRKGLKDKEVGEQLIIDIAKYQNHPNCKILYCFVYDPEGFIRNPRGLEKDLESLPSNIPVKVFIRPL